MTRMSRRRGVGTLLITVLIVLASLFIMAMMQYFAGSITKGKRILAHIAATDYANEAALDEAVLWFRGHANNPASKHKQKDAAQKLHEQLVNKGDSSAETDFDPESTKSMFSKLHKDMVIGKVHMSVDKVQKIGEGKTPKGSFNETEGIIHFSVTTKYETTKKTSVRSLEFRQVVVVPPKDFSQYHFVATGFGYLGRRALKYSTEQDILKKIVAAASERIFFAFSMLTYIAKPDDPAIGGGGPFMVGKTFIDAVNRKAIEMKGGLDGVATELEGDGVKPDGLAYWRRSYNNPNFNLDYVKAMAGASTNKLTQVLTDLKDEFGFKPGQGGNLSPSDPYPLSFNADGSGGEPTDKVLGAAAGYGFKPAQKWGIGGSLDGEMFTPADIKFKSANGGEILLKNIAEEPRIVVAARNNGEFKLSELEFFIHPPPVIPKDVQPDQSLQVTGLSAQDVAECKTNITPKDLEKLASGNTGGSNHFVDLAKAKDGWGEQFKDLADDKDIKQEDYKVPAMSLYHPKSFPDWAFRFPIQWWKDGFSKHYDAFIKWKDATKGSAKYYKETMEKRNKDLPKVFSVMEGNQLPPAVPPPGELGKRASYVFPTAKDFEDAMKALASATGATDSLVMNGVYYVGEIPPDTGNPANPQAPQQPATTTGPAQNQPVTLDKGKYIGQGEIVAPHLVITNGMKATKDKAGNMVLYSRGGQPFELNSKEDIDASIITESILKAKNAPKITGVFVIKDVMCLTAANRSDAKDEKREVDYYYRKLPEVVIKRPDYNQKPVFYSHMTFSSYRISSGGARRGN